MQLELHGTLPSLASVATRVWPPWFRSPSILPCYCSNLELGFLRALLQWRSSRMLSSSIAGPSTMLRSVLFFVLLARKLFPSVECSCSLILRPCDRYASCEMERYCMWFVFFHLCVTSALFHEWLLFLFLLIYEWIMVIVCLYICI